MRQKVAIADPRQLLGTEQEESLRLMSPPLAEQDLGHVIAKLRTHANVLQSLEQPQAALRIIERAR